MSLLSRWLAQPWPLILLPLLVIKLALAWALPLTGDEAYFVLWGRHLDYGYYDHPPMAGWLTWLQLLVSDHRVWIRLPGLLSELIIAGSLHALLREHDADRARWVALLCLVTPLSLLFVFTLTDTGCVLFAALSFVAAARSLAGGSLAWSALAGALLGLAFLSKYFAVFLGLGHVIFFFGRQPARWRQGLVLVATAIPFGLLNLHWNLTHCWSNLLFNLVNRSHAESGIDPVTILTYIGMMVYVLLPPVLLGYRDLRRQGETVSADLAEVLQLARVLGVTAVTGFLLVSLRKEIGLHWVIWCQPFLLLLLWPLPLARLQRITAQVAAIALVHVVLLAGILAWPVSAWKGSVQWNLLALRDAPAILAQAREAAVVAGAEPGRRLPLATQGYSSASVLAYQAREPVMVIGTGSKYARQDDFWTDFRALEGGDVLVLLKREREQATIAPWFREATPFHVMHQGQRFDFMLGRGFRYDRYRDTVLTTVRDTYYAFPDWLPACDCEFTSRYFPPSPSVR